jgi:hypothetical protein
MSNPNASAAVPRTLVWAAVGALLVYGIFLAGQTSVAAGGADSSGYLNSAKLLAAGRLTAPLRTVPEFGDAARAHATPLGFVATREVGRIAPSYPVGLPLHLAAAGLVVGWDWAPLVVSVGGALAAMVLCYLVGRELALSPVLAAAGTVVLGAFPVFIFIAIQPLSDVLATTWCLAAVWLALRSRRAADWAVACGAAFAIAVLVRPTNALLLPALVLLLWGWRRWLNAALGGLPGALWLAYYNHALYGHPLASGYGGVTLESAWFVPTAVHFARWMALLLPAVVLVLPLAALRDWRDRRRNLAALAVWFGTFAVFYALYDVSHESWWCLRFLLPAVPALILGAMLGVDALARSGVGRRWRHGGAIAGGGLALWAVADSVFWTRDLHVFLTKRYELDYADSCRWARDHLPPNAIVACMAASGAIYYYTGLPVLRWDQISAEDFARYAPAAAAAGRPIYALLFAVEREEALQRRMPGRWEKLADFRGAAIWRLTAAP